MNASGMENTLNDLERQILSVVQHGLPMSLTPYQDLADKAGITLERLLEILRQWKADGKIRRLGAIVNHFQIGHGFGAMVVWNVPQNRTEEVGLLFASFQKVSHAYQRPSKDGWSYNVYTMVHAANADELQETIAAMSQQSGISDFRQLRTVKELKKVSPTYIIQQ